MRYSKSDKLYCFSPPIMLATFIIEIAFAIYTVARYKLSPVSRVAVMMLVGLAVFQLAEYNVCKGAWGVDSLVWARIGYVAITLLPPLGLQLATRIAGGKQRLLLSGAYTAAAVFAFIFLFVGHGMQSQQCLGNYVIFTIAPWAVEAYGLYYYGLLIVTVGYIFPAVARLKQENERRALYALALGFLAFIVPTTAANLVDPSTIAGIPSIMCGFAVIFAVILTTVILPNYYNRTKHRSRTLPTKAR